MFETVLPKTTTKIEGQPVKTFLVEHKEVLTQ
jgi:hypothetical protein